MSRDFKITTSRKDKKKNIMKIKIIAFRMGGGDSLVTALAFIMSIIALSLPETIIF